MTEFDYDDLVGKIEEAMAARFQPLYIQLADESINLFFPELWKGRFSAARMRQLSREIPFSKSQRRMIGRFIRRGQTA